MSDRPAESVFWDDLNADLKDEEFRAWYIEASEQIAGHDRRVNAIITPPDEGPQP